jgi:RND family efflux transporter MFP subunit
MLEISGSAPTSGLRFPGRVRAEQRAELAFSVPGRIVEFPAEEGETLSAGALIARLDPASFETRLSAARAEFDKARTDYRRVLEVWEKSKAVAKAEVDQKRTAMEVARSSFAAAKQDAEDTRLTAPFDGVVARRHVENFQNVQAKEPVVSLQNVDQLEIVIHVPERIMRSEPRRAAGYAQFNDVPGRRFPVSLKSYSTEADPQTQTYEVVLGLARPQDVTILPGMSAEVLPGDAPDSAAPSRVAIPLKAVAAGPDGTPRVWVVDPDTDRVASRVVSVGTVQGSDIIVLDGLQIGERIVTAGLGHLREGLWVRPL